MSQKAVDLIRELPRKVKKDTIFRNYLDAFNKYNRFTFAHSLHVNQISQDNISPLISLLKESNLLEGTSKDGILEYACQQSNNKTWEKIIQKANSILKEIEKARQELLAPANDFIEAFNQIIDQDYIKWATQARMQRKKNIVYSVISGAVCIAAIFIAFLVEQITIAKEILIAAFFAGLFACRFGWLACEDSHADETFKKMGESIQTLQKIAENAGKVKDKIKFQFSILSEDLYKHITLILQVNKEINKQN